jgi:hypothetical protein
MDSLLDTLVDDGERSEKVNQKNVRFGAQIHGYIHIHGMINDQYWATTFSENNFFPFFLP